MDHLPLDGCEIELLNLRYRQQLSLNSLGVSWIYVPTVRNGTTPTLNKIPLEYRIFVWKFTNSSSQQTTKEQHLTIITEIDVISKAISKVLFMISISEDTSKPIALNLKVYEQHRTNKRQQPLLKLREMKVEQVVFDDDNNMAMIGKIHDHKL